ncbi:MAG: PspC domain-containing protein [Bacteroidales bacterium]|nr:PspC domain-containing protein [Bacteroidales bacterium]
MKKTLTINLSNQVFHIDEDAYLRLKEYLDRIESHFSNNEERTDIISDIENRISELFAERISAEKHVITLQDVEEIIRIMGDPVEIGGGSETGQDQQRSSSTTKRLYRDPDNRVLGGVCSGIGQYFNRDPIIVRVIFLIIFFGFGIGFLIYIILWIVVPEARTTAQKLEMRGDPVNASNIGKFMRDEFESVKNTFKGKKR